MAESFPILAGLFLIGIGLVAVFFGYRFFRILLPFFGGIAGFVIASNLFPNNWFLALIIGIGIAIVLAIFAYWVWSVFFTISGAIAGASLGASIANSLNLWDWVSWLLVLGMGILFAILVWRFRDEMVIVITSLAGAGLVADGLRGVFGEGTFRDLLWWGVFFVLAAVGIVFQWRRWLRYQMYRDVSKKAQAAVASGTAATAVAKTSTAAAPVASTGTAATSAATTAAAATAATAAAAAAAAAKKSADAADAAAAATKAATVDVTETASAAVAGTAAAVAGAPKLTAEEKQAALNAHLDAILSDDGDRSNLKEGVEFLKDLSPDQAAKLKADGTVIVADILRRGATKQGRA